MSAVSTGLQFLVKVGWEKTGYQVLVHDPHIILLQATPESHLTNYIKELMVNNALSCIICQHQ